MTTYDEMLFKVIRMRNKQGIMENMQQQVFVFVVDVLMRYGAHILHALFFDVPDSNLMPKPSKSIISIAFCSSFSIACLNFSLSFTGVTWNAAIRSWYAGV